MNYDPKIYNRHSLRLQGYDYAQAGAYFVTICVQDRECLFGDVVGSEMRIGSSGEIASRCWDELPQRYSSVELDAFIVMPNHVHGIIVLADGLSPGTQVDLPPSSTRAASIDTDTLATGLVGARFIAPPEPVAKPTKQATNGNKENVTDETALQQENREANPRAVTLGEVVRAFKAVTTRFVRLAGLPRFSWQRNYYEHVIRNERSLRQIREYIVNNPLKWELDELHPDRVGRWVGR